jgi:hypothetical protein
MVIPCLHRLLELALPSLGFPVVACHRCCEKLLARVSHAATLEAVRRGTFGRPVLVGVEGVPVLVVMSPRQVSGHVQERGPVDG